MAGSPHPPPPALRPAGPRPGRTAPPPRPRLAALIVALFRGLGWLSLRHLQALGAAAGWLFGLFPSRPRTTTLESLQIAFPELTPRARARLARLSLVEDARMLFEHAAFWTWAPPRVLAMVHVAEGEEHLTRALAGGRGAILAVLHLGAIEAVNACCAARHDFVGQYRPPRIRELDDFVRRARGRFGGQLLGVGTGSVRELVRGLRAGCLLGVPCDQDPGTGQGVFAPYFGRPTNTTTLIGRLAARTGAEVVLAWAERLPKGAGFALRLEPAPPDVKSTDLARSAAALNGAIERCVRRRPEQALWSYRRFRIRPPAEPAGDAAEAPGEAAAAGSA